MLLYNTIFMLLHGGWIRRIYTTLLSSSHKKGISNIMMILKSVVVVVVIDVLKGKSPILILHNILHTLTLTIDFIIYDSRVRSLFHKVHIRFPLVFCSKLLHVYRVISMLSDLCFRYGGVDSLMVTFMGLYIISHRTCYAICTRLLYAEVL